MPYRRTYKRKSYRKKRGMYAQRRRPTFARRVKRVIMRTAETKYYTGFIEYQPLYHDRGEGGAGLITSNQGAFLFNPWYNITKGTSISQRIGDEVYCRGMSLRFCYWNSADRPAQVLRVIIAVIPKVVGTAIMDGSNFDLLDSAGSNDTVTGMVKKEGVKVLYDRCYTMNAQSSVQSGYAFGNNIINKKIWIRSKPGQKLSWGQDGLLQNKPLGVWVIPYISYAAQRSDIAGRVSGTWKLYFKDP